MAENKNCLLCGVGGQGTVLASKLIAFAAMRRGENVRTSETIGMAQRGGCVVSHVRTGEDIASPLVPKHTADVMIAFEPAEAVRCLDYLAPDGAVIVNKKAVMPITVNFGGTGYDADAVLEYLRANVKKLTIVDGDEIIASEEAENRSELIFFTDRAQVYKCRASDIDPVKASALGDFIAAKLGFEEDERPIMMKAITGYDPADNFIFIFENGKGVKIPASVYETKTNRRRLTGAFSDASPIAAVLFEHEPMDILIENSMGRAILINSSLIPQKSTRTSAGSILFTMKDGTSVTSVLAGEAIDMEKAAKCRKLKIPATGINTML